MDGITLSKLPKLVYRLSAVLVVLTYVLAGAAFAAPAGTIIYVNDPLEASMRLLGYADGLQEYEATVMVDGFQSRDVIAVINDSFRLLTGLRYDLEFSLDSDYAEGRVDVKVVHKDSEYLQEMLQAARKIAAAAKVHSEIEAEQVRYAAEALRAAGYDYDSVNDRENADGLAWSAYGCFIKKQAVCEGYTNAMTLVCQMLDIPVFEVSGAGSKGGAHIWNRVFLDGEWVMLDVTASSRLLADKELLQKGYQWIGLAQIEGWLEYD